MEIQNVKDVKIEDITYGTPTQSAFGGQMLTILKNGNKIYLQTPRSEVPYGKSNYVKLGIDVQTKAGKDFKKFIEEFDETIIEIATRRSKEWFKKRLDRNVVEELYKTQFDNDLFTAKFPTKNGKFIGEVFNASDERIEEEHIEPGSIIQAIIECVGIYFIPKKFGVTWKVHQVKVYPNDKGLSGFCFVDSDDDTT